jgi:hypothetical protein
VQHLSQDQILHIDGMMQIMLISGDEIEILLQQIETEQQKKVVNDHVHHDIMFHLLESGKPSMMLLVYHEMLPL